MRQVAAATRGVPRAVGRLNECLNACDSLWRPLVSRNMRARTVKSAPWCLEQRGLRVSGAHTQRNIGALLSS